ncbi:MAG TPA: hypothetical protein DCW90_23570 [Lachnospiraceae bacterium]|nr:hypothetical protein [Lachnospiraceae bacterium]
MNIFEAIEALKEGKVIKRAEWGDSAVRAVKSNNGCYQICILGDITSDTFSLATCDYEVKDDSADSE